jgi:hypothetical protein
MGGGDRQDPESCTPAQHDRNSHTRMRCVAKMYQSKDWVETDSPESRRRQSNLRM